MTRHRSQPVFHILLAVEGYMPVALCGRRGTDKRIRFCSSREAEQHIPQDQICTACRSAACVPAAEEGRQT
jgi:hypothetical protein